MQINQLYILWKKKNKENMHKYVGLKRIFQLTSQKLNIVIFNNLPLKDQHIKSIYITNSHI